jgi:hypothetical protein
MVGSKRSSKGSKFSMKTTPVAVPSGDPPLGFKHPPTLIGEKTIDPSVIALRAKNYAVAYADPSIRQKWNMYVSFGIQQFVSMDDYVSHRAQETVAERNLRLARYYRYHLENYAPVDSYLIRTMGAVETALAISHPGFFDMSTSDMDQYVASLPEKAMNMEIEHTNDDSTPMDTKSVPPSGSSLAIAASIGYGSDKSTISTDMNVDETHPQTQEGFTAVRMSPKRANAIDDDEVTTGSVPSSPKTPASSTTQTPVASQKKTPVSSPKNTPASSPKKTPSAKAQSSAAPSTAASVVLPPKTPPKNPLRVEVRWAPKDFYELKESTTKMHLRLAPILSCFNTEKTWMMEWQTDQLAESADISPIGLSKFLSIRVLAVVKEKCFYFSFRMNATGSQFMKACQSNVVQTAKRGENMMLDPSSIPPSHGELTIVGDILLKDAAVTHRGQYLQYLRKHVLPSDMPVFDLKLRYKDPVGNKVPILSVRCGKSTSIKTAELLSTALCGEGKNPEIFISRLAIGSNHTSRADHGKIYKVHLDFLNDITYLPFPLNGPIDLPVTEHLDLGETRTQSPRQWAKSLTSEDGMSLEVDIENGKSDGTVVLIVPSASLRKAQLELSQYQARQNPTLSNAERMYSDYASAHSDIPKTVFTKNIDTILAKKIKKVASSSDTVTIDETATTSTPASTLTGTTGAVSKSSLKPSSIAWKRPLQDSLKLQSERKMTSTEINQLKRIAILEAQLALSASVTGNDDDQSKSTKSTKSRRSRSLSKASSRASSPSTERSALTAATAHSRLDGLESSMKDIHRMLARLDRLVPPSPSASPVSPPQKASSLQPAPDRSLIMDPTNGMVGVQLFPEGSESCLAILDTPKKPTNKRRKNTNTPSPKATSNQRLQYTEDPSKSKGSKGAGGGDSC